MSDNDVNTNEDTDMTECDGEKVVTMMDVLQEQQDFEDDANAVLGASDDKNCTYSKGYVKRQALYACLTCSSEAKNDPTKRAGVCLACSLNCHENHELIELYTKRNFRCDCGNPKFNTHPCQFTPNKTELNEDNSYNQNFIGVYCICHRPYPDPESPVEDEMIQCIICEDWLHASHLDATVPTNDQYSEMICKACMERNDFLHEYSDLAVNSKESDGIKETLQDDENTEVDITAAIDSIIGNSDSEFNGENLVNGTKDSSSISNENESKDSTKADENGEEHVTTDEVPQEEEKIKDELEHHGDIQMQTEQEKAENEVSLENEGAKEPLQDLEYSNEPNTESSEQNFEDLKTNSNKQTLDSEKALETKESNDIDNTLFTASVIDNKTEEQIETSNEIVKIDTTRLEPTSEEIVENQTPESDVNLAEAQTDKEQTRESSEKCDNIEEGNNQNIEEANRNIDETSDQNIEEPNGTCGDPVESHNKDEIEENLSKIGTEETETTESETTNEAETAQQHTTCGDNEVENNDNSEENCSEQNTVSNGIDSESNLTETVNEEKEDTVADIKEVPTDIEMKDDTANENELSDKENEAPLDSESVANENKRKLPTEESNQDDDIIAKKPKLNDTEDCKRPKGTKKMFKGATFWPSNFRQKLCTCSECISMYKDLSVLFLIDPEDTVTAYENLGKEKINGAPSTQYEKGLQALSSLDRVQQINALTEYNKMRDKLLEFLKSFKDRKEIVKEEDIKAFFAGMKPKREPDGVYFCR